MKPILTLALVLLAGRAWGAEFFKWEDGMPCKICFSRPKVIVDHGPTYDEKTHTWHLNFATDAEVKAANRCLYCEYLDHLEPEPPERLQITNP